jgi:hypothetical protein
MAETKTVWKFDLSIENCGQVQEVEIPEGAMPLSVLNQNEKLVLYALVSPAKRPVKHKFKVFMTGQAVPFNANMQFVGTASFDGGAFVVHVFETDRW